MTVQLTQPESPSITAIRKSIAKKQKRIGKIQELLGERHPADLLEIRTQMEVLSDRFRDNEISAMKYNDQMFHLKQLYKQKSQAFQRKPYEKEMATLEFEIEIMKTDLQILQDHCP